MKGAGAGAERKGDADDAAVEELLREAQDDLLLKLRLNPHATAADDDSILGADLARRFQALKSPSVESGSKASKPSSSEGGLSEAEADEESKKILGNDLSARFAVLKGAPAPTVQGDSRSMLGIADSDGDGDGDDEEKEVERVIQWAMDAARLDPSKSDDDDDDGGGGGDDDDDDDGDGDDEKKVERKPRRWIFF